MSGSGEGDVAEVQQQLDSDLVSEAQSHGIDVDSIVSDVMAEKSAYSTRVKVRFAEAALRSRIEAAETESQTGIVMGSRDRAGNNWPRRYSLLRSNGDHLEVAAWSGTLDNVDGGESRIPIGHVAEINAEYDGEYDSWEAKAIGPVQELEPDELRERVVSVARPPSSLSRDDEYETVAVHGVIGYISPQTLFEDGERVGTGDVLMLDKRGEMRPHFEVTLVKDGNTVVHGHVEQQRYGEPLIDLPDSGLLFEDARTHRETAEEQCSLLRDAWMGERVVVVGNVSSYDTHRNEGQTTEYIDIQASAIIDVPEDTEETADQRGAAEGDSEAAEGGDSGESDVAAITTDIAQYCSLTGTASTQLTPGDVREKIDTVPDETPDAVVQAALDRVGGADEDDSSDDEPEPEPSQDPLERVENPDGTYACPADGCHFSGSEAALYGHANDHTSGDPREWVMNNA